MHFIKTISLVLTLFLFSGCALMPKGITPQEAALTQALQEADYAYTKQNWSLAVSRYQKVVELWPKEPFGYFRLGNAYLQKGDLNSAIRQYENVIQVAPNYAKAYNNLSIAHTLKAQDLLLVLDQKLKPSDFSARDSVRQRLQIMEELLITPVLGMSQ